MFLLCCNLISETHKGGIMKKGKPEVVQARVDEGMRLKIKKMTEKLDCSEATVIRLALKKFFASSGNKSITL